LRDEVPASPQVAGLAKHLYGVTTLTFLPLTLTVLTLLFWGKQSFAFQQALYILPAHAESSAATPVATAAAKRREMVFIVIERAKVGRS
jgi:hypothetical protein